MTREEAIKEIANHLNHWKKLREGEICGEADGENAINAFEMAIQALKQTRWIPVSERLPEEEGEYLATIYDMDENYEYMDIAEFEDDKWCYKPYILVKAWMPLPEPFKEE